MMSQDRPEPRFVGGDRVRSPARAPGCHLGARESLQIAHAQAAQRFGGANGSGSADIFGRSPVISGCRSSGAHQLSPRGRPFADRPARLVRARDDPCVWHNHDRAFGMHSAVGTDRAEQQSDEPAVATAADNQHVSVDRTLHEHLRRVTLTNARAQPVGLLVAEGSGERVRQYRGGRGLRVPVRRRTGHSVTLWILPTDNGADLRSGLRGDLSGPPQGIGR